MFDPSDEGNDSSPQIIVTGLIVGETYNIYPEDPDPLTGCDSGSKQEVEADATSMSFSLENNFLGTENGAAKTICIKSTSYTSDPLKSTNTYTLDNSAPVQLANLAIPGRVNLSTGVWTGKLSDGLPAFTFEASESGATVNLYDNGDCSGNIIGSAVNQSGSVTGVTIENSTDNPFALIEGDNVFSVEQTDGLNTSVCSSSVTYKYDATAPANPVLAISSFVPSSLNTYSVTPLQLRKMPHC